MGVVQIFDTEIFLHSHELFCACTRVFFPNLRRNILIWVSSEADVGLMQ